MKYYMHTLNGMPGFFDGYQVCYASASSGARFHNILVESLRQIWREQQATIRNRTNDGFTTGVRMSYILVYTPKSDGEGQ